MAVVGLLFFHGAAALLVSVERGGYLCASSIVIGTSPHQLSGRQRHKRVTAASWGAGGRRGSHWAKIKAWAAPRSLLKSLGENVSPCLLSSVKASRILRRMGPSLFLQSQRHCISLTLLRGRHSLRLFSWERFTDFKDLLWFHSGLNQITQYTLPTSRSLTYHDTCKVFFLIRGTTSWVLLGRGHF